MLVSSILRDKKGGPMLLVGAALCLGGLILGAVRGAAVWTVLVAVGLVVAMIGALIASASWPGAERIGAMGGWLDHSSRWFSSPALVWSE
ncbi:MAG: hypothetical protein LC713_02645, partial [Actinobacteria bacterium]|nr:hypothetical protein [Actinomycetota bacterium]